MLLIFIGNVCLNFGKWYALIGHSLVSIFHEIAVFSGTLFLLMIFTLLLTHLRLTVFAKSVPSGLAVFSLFKKIIKKKVLKILLRFFYIQELELLAFNSKK